MFAVLYGSIKHDSYHKPSASNLAITNDKIKKHLSPWVLRLFPALKADIRYKLYADNV